ncbi:3-hydroxybutyrate dehydrogenase [Thiotrichales bacterium 19S3-7]|nr:3-hydroxybutyrate dehydrogenase [Thiotrichales bacterium 19S3-7]MCF6801909.1 3-hydroxybutyrate dehydrogenase [Thiotrichales bacterium 19S3-11]
MRLKDKVSIITGAASGIGKAIALEYAKEGAIVVIADLNFNAASAVANEIETSGFKAYAIAMDVTDEAAVNNAIDEVINRYNHIDILISNAGIQHIAAIDQLDYQKWKLMLSIHLDGAFLTTKACIKHMYKNNSGSIIYMGSVHSKDASKLKAPYVTAKHGLLGLCRVVAKEGAAHNVRANVICPGFVKTPLVEKQIPQQAKALNISEDEVIKNIMLKDTVDGQFTTVKDIAECAIFFGSFNSNALTGQSIIASHGWFME